MSAVPDSRPAVEGLNRWVGLFAAACQRAVDDTLRFEDRIKGIQAEWTAAVGRVRRNSAVHLLIGALPGAPILTVKSAARLIERSFERTNEAIARLETAGVVRPITVGRRNRAFEAPAVIDAFGELERRLGSPEGGPLDGLSANVGEEDARWLAVEAQHRTRDRPR